MMVGTDSSAAKALVGSVAEAVRAFAVQLREREIADATDPAEGKTAAGRLAQGAWFSVIGCDGQTLAQSEAAPVSQTVIADTAAAVMDRYPLSGWQVGDLFINNDPYAGGLSLDALIILAPIFEAGRPAALVGGVVPYGDVGAMRDEVTCVGREIFHEGFRIPLVRVSEDGELLAAVLERMLSANARHPDERLAVFRGQHAAVRRLVTALNGVSEDPPQHCCFCDLGRRADHALAERARLALALLPGGFGTAEVELRWEQNELEPIIIGASVEVHGGRVRVSFDSDIDESLEAIHSPWAGTHAAAVAAVADWTGAPAWVVARGVEVVIPTSRLLCARYPGGVGRFGWTAYACYRATSQALVSADSNHPFEPASPEEFLGPWVYGISGFSGQTLRCQNRG